MGAWGWKIFQNDDACDIRDTYKERVIVGDSDIDAENSVVEEFELNKFPSLWVPLALTEWKVGRLTETAKENAFRGIEEELSELEELWEPEHVKKRREELLRTREQLQSQMPARKKLRLPWWSWKCPWPAGSVLQYKLRYRDSDDPFADHYVLLLIQGISETPPGKIPKEKIAVSLYNWSSAQAPSSSKNEWENPPKLIPFVTQEGDRQEVRCITLLKQHIQDREIKCIRKSPFSPSDYKPSEVYYYPLNWVFDDMICRALNE